MDATTNSPVNLALLMDVKVKLTVELGSCKMPMADVLHFDVGSIVKLDQPTQAPVVISVNQTPIARGEVVVVDDVYGIKILELLAPKS